MPNLRKKTKDTFDNIVLSKEQEENILNNILKKKPKSYLMKPIIIGSILLVFGATFCLVNADDIKHTFNTLIIKKIEKETADGEKYSITKTNSEGVVEINKNADISKFNSNKGTDKIQLKLEDIEKELGINILKSLLSTSKYITIDNVEIENNKITQLSLVSENISNELPDKVSKNGELQFNRDYTECNMYIYFKTQYFDKTSENSLNTVAPRGSKTEEYYINKLDTTALIVKFETDENSHSKVWDVIFDYKNITYKFTFFFHGTDPKKELKRFMDSLEY